MGRYVLRRLLQAIPVFIGTTFLIYLMVWGLPGNPFAGRCGQRPCPDAYIQRMTEKYHLNENIISQYFWYMSHLVRGDFGETFTGVSVNSLLAQAFPVTLRLAIVAIAFEALIGIVAGVVTGLRKGRFIDNLVLVSTLFLIAIPTFVTGALLQWVLGVEWGIIKPTVSSEARWSELIVPGFVLASVTMAFVTRLTRVSVVENRRADYVRTAVAKGLTESRVTGVHLLRNSLIPAVTQLGLDLGGLMAGAIVTEGIFNIRGIGGMLFMAINRQDSALVVSIVALLVLVYLVVNLIVDVLYAVLDPRIRYE
ncbi:MAG: ABC transporter permease [Micromonosporaceae bacterium]|nr:ABC transporter permease [Micromonosporaceae bacterium]